MIVHLGAIFFVQFLVCVWFQTIEEQYRAISYIDQTLRPRVAAIVKATGFWAYEASSAGRADRVNWLGELDVSCSHSPFAGGLCGRVDCSHRPSLNGEAALFVLDLAVLWFQFAKVTTQGHSGRSLSAQSA